MEVVDLLGSRLKRVVAWFADFFLLAVLVVLVLYLLSFIPDILAGTVMDVIKFVFVFCILFGYSPVLKYNTVGCRIVGIIPVNERTGTTLNAIDASKLLNSSFMYRRRIRSIIKVYDILKDSKLRSIPQRNNYIIYIDRSSFGEFVDRFKNIPQNTASESVEVNTLFGLQQQ